MHKALYKCFNQDFMQILYIIYVKMVGCSAKNLYETF